MARKRPGRPPGEIVAFIRAAKPILIAAGMTEYSDWEQKVAGFEKAGMARKLAVISASKDFACLASLLASSGILGSKEDTDGRMILEDREQSHLDNLRWAAAAAGRAKLTHKQPASCPNYTAYGFYEQAMDDYKAFMATLNQAEGKVKQEAEGDDQVVSAEKLSIEEIDMILEQI